VAYIERELTEGEKLILLGKVSWWTVVPRTALAVAVLAVAGVVAGMLGFLGNTVFWLVTVPVVLVAWIALVARQVVRIVSTEVAITDRRVMSKTGVMRTEVKTTPLDKVNNVNVTRSLAGNMLDYGDIEITTATAESSDNHLVKALADPDKFRNTLTGLTQA
jgi:uncharacterized membrane protein YdbT with pleckstrin-like domain